MRRVCGCIGLGLLSVGALNCAETPEQLVADAQMHLASQDLEALSRLFVAVPDDQAGVPRMVRAQAFAAAHRLLAALERVRAGIQTLTFSWSLGAQAR